VRKKRGKEEEVVVERRISPSSSRETVGRGKGRKEKEVNKKGKGIHNIYINNTKLSFS